MIYTNLEINFQRLLSKTEEIAEKQDQSNWRLEKYVASLENYLKELNKLVANKPSVDTLKDYTRRVDFLKKIGNLKEKKVNENTNPIVNATIPNPGPIITKKDVKPKQIYHKTQLNQENLLRDELLGKNRDEPVDNETSDVNKLLSEHNRNQEKIANEMIKSVRAIKEHSLLASTIIKGDQKLLSDLNSTAEQNMDNLKGVNDHLTERVSRSCNSWIWFMILIIMGVFIMMVLFMKLFPKKRYYSSVPTTQTVTSEATYTHFLNNNTILIDNQTIHKFEL